MAGRDQSYVIDGDAVFVKVDTSLPPHELGEGVAADAVNKRFEDGRAWPRYGAMSTPWGKTTPQAANLITSSPSYANGLYNFPALNVGQGYLLVLGPHEQGGANGGVSVIVPANLVAANTYFFVATNTVLVLTSGAGGSVTVTATVNYAPIPCGCARFIDPDGLDNLVILSDEWRTGAMEDGGRGRAWRIVPGNAPAQIPLNGHDVYGQARLVPCFNGLLLLRQDAERHYVQAAAFNSGTNVITFNVQPNWATGDLVLFFAFPNSYVLGTSPPNPNTTYYIQMTGAKTGKLWGDPAFTVAIDFAGGATGQFYFERRATTPGFYGNGAPPLLMQSDGSGAKVWQLGFKSVPAQIFATAFSATTLVLSAAAHRLVPGDQITYFHTNNTQQTFYVNPVSSDAVMLFTSQILALGGLLANAQTPSPAQTAGDYIMKVGASGLPMPPLREAIYTEVNRLVGVNGATSLPISDPLDPLHFAPLLSTVNATLGQGNQVNALLPMSKDRFIIAKDIELLQFLGISQGSTSWQITNLTKEYGWIAPLSCIAVGKDGWGLSRKGITSVFQTELGEIQGLSDPVSRPMKKYVDQIDWIHANQSCAGTWNNRVYFAVPLKGQTGPVYNNGVMVYNILNQGWEGLWKGAALQVYCFARCTVAGQERLCWLNYFGQVSYFDQDALTDGAVQIPDLLVTRTYSGQDQSTRSKSKLWLICDTIWDTFNPSLTVTASTPGVNEIQTLALNRTYDRTQYQTYGTAPYVPGSPANFMAPERQDYSPGPGELLFAGLDLHQDVPERFRMRINDWGVSISIANAQGSARIQSVTVRAMPTIEVASIKA